MYGLKRVKFAEFSFELKDSFNPIALRKAKIVYNFGFSECNRVKYAEYKDFQNSSQKM